MNPNYKHALIATSLAILIAGCKDSSDSDPVSDTDPIPDSSSGTDDTFISLPTPPEGRWVAGDMHVHSTGSDGFNIVTDVLDQGFGKYDADFIVITDHGGTSNYDIDESLARLTLQGVQILNPTPNEELHSYSYAKNEFPNDKNSDNKHAIFNHIYSALTGYRSKIRNDQYLMMGMEWTMPNVNEHATLVFSDDGINIDNLNEFHTLYQSRGGSDPDSHLVDAARYLQEGFKDKAFFSFNHPSRKDAIKIETIRDVHNAGPDVMLGMEGAPGHQKNPLGRGWYRKDAPVVIEEYKEKYGIAYHGQTYGGFDFMTTRVGGVWDALLSEGRMLSIFAHSDFHHRVDDFWPAEYSKSNLFMTDESQEGLIKAVQSGKSYVTHGDLIKDLYFVATDSEDTGNYAWMGDTLEVPSGKNVEVFITMENPSSNFNGDDPDLKFVDVIAGKVTGKVNPQDPEYSKPFTDNTEVVATFTKGDSNWTEEGNIIKLKYTFENVGDDMYIRLRGSNNEKGTENFVDEKGNPIIDLKKDYSNVAQMAWDDLWFYSNPIFISAE